MDRYVYDLGEGRTMHLRSANWGEPDMEIRFVVRDGEKEIVSPPLPDVQLSILAHAFADYFFQRTGRIAWPVEESMLHCYERRRQESAERAQHLSPPAYPRPERAEEVIRDVERAEEVIWDVERQAEAPPTEVDNEDPPQKGALKPAPGRRRIV